MYDLDDSQKNVVVGLIDGFLAESLWIRPAKDSKTGLIVPIIVLEVPSEEDEDDVITIPLGMLFTPGRDKPMEHYEFSEDSEDDYFCTPDLECDGCPECMHQCEDAQDITFGAEEENAVGVDKNSLWGKIKAKVGF